MRSPIESIKRIPIEATVYTPISAFVQEPYTDAWGYILLNFDKLVRFHANRYAFMINKPYLIEDFHSDMLLELVKTYKKYYIERELPLKQVDKILKTVLGYYYQNEIKRKKHSATSISMDTTDIQIKETDNFFSTYDKQYTYFVDNYLLIKDDDQKALVNEVVATSKDFIKFMKEHSYRYPSQKSLRAYFIQKKDWSLSRFKHAFNSLREVA